VGLGVGLLLTLVVWGMLRRAEGDRLMGLHLNRAAVMSKHLEDRVQGLEQVLRGASGYLGRGQLPTRQEWQAYVASLNLPSHAPGVQGLSFVAWVPWDQRKAHETEVRGEGFPDYTVMPGGPLPADHEGAGVVCYIEPMDARNQRAFGKDMLVDPLRREALLAARDQGRVTISAPVKLYQETESDPQVGTVLYAPVYAQGVPSGSVTERRKAFRGWAAIPLRMTNLIEATLARDLRTLDLQLVDATPGDPEQPLFASALDPRQTQRHAVTRPFVVGGRTWTARIAPNATFFVEAGLRSHWEVLASGVVGSMLLFTLLMLMHGAERRAKRLARLREAELRATELRFQALFETAPLGMAIVDSATGRFLSVNPRMGDILGYPAVEVLGRGFQEFTHPDHLAADLASVRQLAAGSVPEVHKEKRYIHRDGHEVWARLSMVRLPGPPDQAVRHLALVEDITEARQRQAELRDSEARFRALFNLLPLGVTVTDDRGHIVASNPVSEVLLGIPSDDLVRREFKGPYWDIIRADGRPMPPEEYASVRALQEQRRIDAVEMGVRRPDGSVTWIVVSAEPIRVPGLGVLIVYRDISERRLAEQQLVTSEARWQFALEGSGEGVWDWREDCNDLYFSPAYKTMLGYGPEEEVAARFDDWIRRIHPEDRDQVQGQVEAYLEGRSTIYQTEYRIQHRDGSYLWVLARGMAVERAAEGRPTRMIGTHADITERKKAEAALQHSESRLRILADHLPDSFLFQLGATPDQLPRFIYVSAGVERICGVKPEQVLADSSLLFGQMDPAMVPAYLEAEAASARDLSPFVMEFRNRRADGEWRWFRVRSAPRQQADGSMLWEGIATDITESKLGHLLLEYSEARFRGVVESAGDAIYLHDEDGHILLCNSEACRSTGYTMEELQRLHVSDLDASYMEERNGLARKALEVGQQISIQTRHRRKDGSTFPVEIRIGLLRAESPRQILAVARDLSDREQLQESELRTRKAESLVLMAGSIAHDFNNLFQGVLGFLEMAGMNAGGDPAIIGPLDRAEEALRQAIGLSWKMLDFSGRGLVQAQRLDLETWLPSCLADLHLDLPSTFRLDLHCETVPLIQGDQPKLEQVVRAMVDNAREAASALGGRVRLHLRVDYGVDHPGPDSPGIWPLPRPEVPATVSLEIADDGPGIPPGNLSLVCDPFYTTKELGRGLGLAAAVGILRAHRAGLHLFNQEGGGLVLRIHFPPSGV